CTGSARASPPHRRSPSDYPTHDTAQPAPPSSDTPAHPPAQKSPASDDEAALAHAVPADNRAQKSRLKAPATAASPHSSHDHAAPDLRSIRPAFPDRKSIPPAPKHTAQAANQ